MRSEFFEYEGGRGHKGGIINLQNVFSIKIDQILNEYYVIAQGIGSSHEDNTHECVLFDGSEEECKAYFEKLKQRL